MSGAVSGRAASPGRGGPADTGGVSIIGLGASGVAAARLALAKGERVHVSDLRTDARATASADELRTLGALVDLGDHDVARIAAAGCVVVSPGIPPDAPVLRDLRARGVRWVSEPEFAVRFFDGSLIAVTGTNGKTTTATLTAHLLAASGIDAALGGNVGGGLAPAASALALRDPVPAWFVLEVSSFQLADTETFSPTIGVVTSLAPDHLDRYPSVEAYFADKRRLFHNAGPGSRWVLNGESAAVRDLPGPAPGTRYLFARDADATGREPREGEVGVCAFVRDGVLTLRIPQAAGGSGEEEPVLPVRSLPLLGGHNVMNALAAALIARLVGASAAAIGSGLATFRPLPHRMEPVFEAGGVLWVNDSKATNVEAARSALESMDRPIVALLGGKDKGEDFRSLAAPLRARARAVVLFGEAADRLARELGAELGDGWTPTRVGGLEEAVTEARRAALSGDVVLLSPACSSFDLFENYEHRGRRFAELAAGPAGEGTP